MSSKHHRSDLIHKPRHNLKFDHHVKDTYINRKKLTEPTVCPDCGAIFHKGHWQWNEASPFEKENRFPACNRIHDKVPAGILTLQGEFFNTHKSEIIHPIQNKEQKEKSQHVLERIMSIKENQEPLLTVTNYTGMHLSHSTGQGKEYEYTDKDGDMPARWVL